MKKKILLNSSFLFIFDQLTKFLVERFIGDNKITIIPNFFNIDLAFNTGGAFSIMNKYTIIIILASFLCIYFLKEIQKEIVNSKLKLVTFSLLYGGIFGNLFDRILFGGVRDFLDFEFWGYHFPTFNFADVFIVIGMILLIIFILGRKERVYENVSSSWKRLWTIR